MKALAAKRATRARALAWAAALLGVAACSAPEHGRNADARPRVVASVPPHCFAVEALAGDRVRCSVLLPPGANPATYEPTLAALRALEAARLYVKVGHPQFPFERAWLDALLAERLGLAVVDAAAALPQTALLDEDPHLWLAPSSMRALAGPLSEALAGLLPDAADHRALDRGRQTWLAEIDALDAQLRDTFRGREGQAFYVFHPAWGYFAREYGLVQIAIERHHKAPGAAALARLIDEARRRGVRVIFVQPHFDAAAARTLAAEVGARLEVIDPLARDWEANLRAVALRIAAGLVP